MQTHPQTVNTTRVDCQQQTLKKIKTTNKQTYEQKSNKPKQTNKAKQKTQRVDCQQQTLKRIKQTNKQTNHEKQETSNPLLDTMLFQVNCANHL